MSDTTSAQTVDPTVAGELLAIRDEIDTLKLAIRRLSSDLADSLSIRVATVQCERDVVPPLELDPGPRLAIGDAVVVKLSLGGHIEGRVTGFVLAGDQITVNGGKRHGVVTVSVGRVIPCPGWWLE